MPILTIGGDQASGEMLSTQLRVVAPTAASAGIGVESGFGTQRKRFHRPRTAMPVRCAEALRLYPRWLWGAAKSHDGPSICHRSPLMFPAVGGGVL